MPAEARRGRGVERSRRRRGRSSGRKEATDGTDTAGAADAEPDGAQPAAEERTGDAGEPAEATTTRVPRDPDAAGGGGAVAVRGRVAESDEQPDGDEDVDRPDGADTAELGDGGAETDETDDQTAAQAEEAAEAEEEGTSGGGSRRRRRRRRRSSGDDSTAREDDPDNTVVHVREPRASSSGAELVQGVRGSTRLEAKRQRRRDSRESSRRRPQILTEAEFLARRESVERVMAVRQRGDLAQVALLEDGILVEHFVSQTGSDSLIGSVFLGKVQNVLPSMEAAFVDIGRGRNAVIYAGEVNWDAAGLGGKARRIESALTSGDTILAQVSKDAIGHKAPG